MKSLRKSVGAAVLAVSLGIGGTLLAGDPAQAAPAVKTAPSVLAGQFCKDADVGKVVTADNGRRVKCVDQGSNNRWIIK